MLEDAEIELRTVGTLSLAGICNAILEIVLNGSWKRETKGFGKEANVR